jgi:hypothetical protein
MNRDWSPIPESIIDEIQDWALLGEWVSLALAADECWPAAVVVPPGHDEALSTLVAMGKISRVGDGEYRVPLMDELGDSVEERDVEAWRLVNRQ